MILIPLFALINALRGSDIISKPLAAGIMGIIAGIYAQTFMGYSIERSSEIIIIVMAGLYLGLVCGYGKYFAVFTGNMATINESEVKPIDWIVNKLLGVPATVNELKIWSFVAFTLRGLFFYIPFLAFGFYKPEAFIYGLATSLMGVVYGAMNLAPQVYAVRIAESIYGALLGALVYISL